MGFIKVAEKVFVGETERCKRDHRKAEIIYLDVFKKNDKRTIYNVCYKDGDTGVSYIKRFNVTSMTRDRGVRCDDGNAEVAHQLFHRQFQW